MNPIQSHSDQHHRTLHYVEVIYLEKMKYHKRKHEHYPEKEAATMYMRTINKFREDKKNAIICLREENHQLLKCELI